MRPPWSPYQITSAVPTHGTSAASPGKSVSASYRNTGIEIRQSPIKIRASVVNGDGEMLRDGRNSANEAPSISSHARDGSR